MTPGAGSPKVIPLYSCSLITMIQIESVLQIKNKFSFHEVKN